MAELLIVAFGDGVSDTQWTRGHVVTVQPDGHPWTVKEGLPTFYKILIPGATVAECWGYLDAVTNADGTTAKLRGKKLDYNSLSTPLKNQLNRDGYLTVTKAQADAYIKSVT